MAASITDKFTKVSTGTVTSLASPGKAVGATSININSATNYPTDTAVFFAIRRVDPSLITSTNTSGVVANTYTVWKGTVTGTTISNLVLQSGGGADQIYAAGTNTQVFIDLTSAQMNSLIDGLLVQHNNDGTHKSLTTDTLTVSTGTTLPNNDIQANELATSAITLGYTQTTASFSTTLTSATQITGLTATVTIPAGGRRVKITAHCRDLYNTTNNAGAYLSIWDGTVGTGTQIGGCIVQAATAIVTSAGLAIAVVSPAPGTKTYNVGLHSTVTGNANIEAATGYPAFILVEAI